MQGDILVHRGTQCAVFQFVQGAGQMGLSYGHLYVRFAVCDRVFMPLSH